MGLLYITATLDMLYNYAGGIVNAIDLGSEIVASGLVQWHNTLAVWPCIPTSLSLPTYPYQPEAR